jgi:hypothetical protein
MGIGDCNMVFMADKEPNEQEIIIPYPVRHNGGVKKLLAAILTITVVTCLAVIVLPLWPLPTFVVTDAHVLKNNERAIPSTSINRSVFHPGEELVWSIDCSETPDSTPVRHAIQVILEYPGSNIIESYEQKEVLIDEEMRLNRMCKELGKLTLPDGNYASNRRFKIRHIYTVIGGDRRKSVYKDTPWYQIGEFTKFEKKK